MWRGADVSEVPSSDVAPEKIPTEAHYFVDEAGDDALFSGRGKVMVGAEGCSKYFIIGALMVNAPDALSAALNSLRADLLADPYFKDVPSMQSANKKTALGFHAKDDLPEVRREVFRILLKHDMKFFAVVRDKASVLTYVRERNSRETDYRYRPAELYDTTVARLFKDRLHVADACHVTFAARGSSDRTKALHAALELACSRFESKWERTVNSSLAVVSSTPVRSAPLQAADYILWALQRFYERDEDRFLRLMWEKVSLVHDVDDRRVNSYGMYYTKKKPPRSWQGAA